MLKLVYEGQRRGLRSTALLNKFLFGFTRSQQRALKHSAEIAHSSFTPGAAPGLLAAALNPEAYQQLVTDF